MQTSPLTLSFLEARVVAVLFEKQRTVPDTYPLTLNSLVAGCNQKTSRAPVIEASAAEVQAALDSLKAMSLAIESSGGRAMRYEHNLTRVLKIPEQSAALLAVLMLRGPQTAGELRIASERLHAFADISSVEAFLEELANRPAGGLVRLLPRQPGERESRWGHLLCGEPAVEAPGSDGRPTFAHPSAEASLVARVESLEAELAVLKQRLARVCEKLGVDPQLLE
ncbi:MAG: YceH family protein [Burkholderiales bacterium]|nr:YceH family protein [Burkholderiales bacterium]